MTTEKIRNNSIANIKQHGDGNKLDHQAQGDKCHTTRCYFQKYIYTLLLMFTHMVYAMSYNTFGPAFVDLKYTLQSTMQWISLFSTLLSTGNILGTLIGLSFRYLNRQLTIVVLLVVMAITSSAVPFTDHLWQYYLCALLYGLGAGAWTTVNNVWLIEMWDSRSEQVLFLSQLMYGVGAIIGPLIDSPFLTGEVEPRNHTAMEMPQSNHTQIDVEERRSKLQIPFLVSGAIQITLPILMLILFAIRRYRPLATSSGVANANGCNGVDIGRNGVDNGCNGVSDGCNGQFESAKTRCVQLRLFDQPAKPRLVLIVLMAITLAVINSLELVFFSFGSTYMQFSSVRLSASTAAGCTSVMSAAYAGGQAINFFVAMCLRTKYIIGYHFLVSIGAIIALNFISSETGLWVMSAVIGFGFSALFPAILAYMSKYIEISNRIGSIIYLTCGIVNFVPPLILGSYIENNHLVFVLIELVYLAISSSTFLSILFLIKRSR